MLKQARGQVASTALVAVAAVTSAASWSGYAQAGFHPLLMVACLLPVQCAALVWAWQRNSNYRLLMRPMEEASSHRSTASGKEQR